MLFWQSSERLFRTLIALLLTKVGQHIGYSCSAQRKTIKDVEVVLHSAKQKVINAVLHSAS